jgi:hypothetical protein
LSALISCLARPLALGMIEERDAVATVVLREPSLPAHIARHLLRQSADSFANQRALDEYRIRREVWPLCEARQPGEQILAKADATRPKTMRPDEVLEQCRTVARSTQRRRQHG